MCRKADEQFQRGDLLPAEQTAEAALRAESDPEKRLECNLELAKIFLYQGQIEKAAATLDGMAPPSAAREILIRKNLLLAMTKVRLGDLPGARRAVTLAESLKPEGDLASEWHGVKGSIALSQGSLKEASRWFRLALSEDQQRGNRFHESQMLLNLGVVALQDDRYEDAMNLFDQASKEAHSIKAGQVLANALGNLGWTHFLTGDISRATSYLQAAELQSAANGAFKDRVHWLTDLGMAQFRLGDTVASRQSYQTALSLATSLKNPEKILRVHIALAYLLLPSDVLAAEVHIRAAQRIAGAETDPSEALEPMLLEALRLARTHDMRAAEEKLRVLITKSASSAWVQWEAENTLATLYAQTARPQKAGHWFQRAIQTFHTQRLSLRSVELQLPFLETGNDLYLAYVDFLVTQHRTMDALRVLDDSRAEALAEGLGTSATGTGSPVDPRKLAARLHATLLIYCLRPDRSFLWAIDPHREGFYTLPGKNAILPVIARHNDAILASKDLLTQPDSTGRALYDALIKPAQAQLPPGTRVLLLADDGLSRLNFETLIPPPHTASDSPHYWIEEMTLTNARSLRLLAAAHPALSGTTRRPNLLLIGDPAYNPGEYASLPNAAAEMKSVAAHFLPASETTLSGPLATPAAYTATRAAQANFVHFVAHATASELNPLDSAIILSHPAPGAPEKLYANDILKQPLSAELVTLSSCYGTGTRNYTGEGLVGLVWAFLRAGAHAVIGARWEVSDVSTPRLMDTLYTQLLHGNRPDAALREAKLRLLHSSGVFRKPVYWAAFELYAGR